MERTGGLPEFEQLRAWAERDPDGFEAWRQQTIEQALAEVPAARRERMRALQWRIDQERRRARTPLGACVRLSRMMWASVAGNRGLLDVLNNGVACRRATARVLPLRRH